MWSTGKFKCCGSEGTVVSVQVSGGTEAKVGDTADAIMSVHETQGAVSEAHVIPDDVIARERWANGWKSRVVFNCVLDMSKRSGAGILAGNSFRGGSSSRWCTVVREGVEFSRAVRIVPE